MGRGYLYPQAWQGVDMTHCPSWLQGPRREGVGGGGVVRVWWEVDRRGV